jgi:hypothetical protein
MGQINVNPSTPSGPSESGIGMGMLVGIAVVILVVVVLIFLAGPRIFSPNTNQRSVFDVPPLVA